MSNLRLKIEEQIKTLYILENTKSFQLLELGVREESNLLKDLEHELQWRVVHELSCIDIMFRLLNGQDVVLKMYGYNDFEQDLNKSALGYKCPVAYYKVWELYETVFKAKIQPHYEKAISLIQDTAIDLGKDPNQLMLMDSIANLHGFSCTEEMTVHLYLNEI